MCTVMITGHLGSGLLKFRLKKMTLITGKSTDFFLFFSLHEIMWPKQFGKWWGKLAAVILKIMQHFWIWLPENFGVDSMQHPRRHMHVHTHTHYLVVHQKNDKRERTLAVELRNVVRGEGLHVSFMFFVLLSRRSGGCKGFASSREQKLCRRQPRRVPVCVRTGPCPLEVVGS